MKLTRKDEGKFVRANCLHCGRESLYVVWDWNQVSLKCLLCAREFTEGQVELERWLTSKITQRR